MSKDYTFCRKSSRFPNWDYSWKGLYFVTIKTQIGENYFGEIDGGQVKLNIIGMEVEKQWLVTPLIRPDMNIHLDEYVVMPNHFHGIIGIGSNEYNTFPVLSINIGSMNGMILSDSSGQAEESKSTKGKFGPQRKNLGSIIRGFKSSVTCYCRKNHLLFDWQPRYHDVLIRDENKLNLIRKYIRNNPLNWERDRFNKSQKYKTPD